MAGLALANISCGAIPEDGLERDIFSKSSLIDAILSSRQARHVVQCYTPDKATSYSKSHKDISIISIT